MAVISSTDEELADRALPSIELKYNAWLHATRLSMNHSSCSPTLQFNESSKIMSLLDQEDNFFLIPYLWYARKILIDGIPHAPKVLSACHHLFFPYFLCKRRDYFPQ